MVHLALIRSLLLAVTVVLVAPSSLASAGQGGSPDISVPTLKVGDSWTYDVHHLNQTPTGFGPVTPEDRYLVRRAFVQEGAGETRDAQGHGAGVAVLTETQTWREDRDETEVVTYGIAPDGAAISSLRLHRMGGSGASNEIVGAPGNLTILQFANDYQVLETTSFGHHPFCGHRSTLQGQAVDKGAATLHGCGGDGEFIGLAGGEWQGMAARVFGLAADPESLQAWYVAGRPVPVRILDARTSPVVLHEMSSFDAGKGPLSYGSGRLPDLPDVGSAPREPYGPVESGVEHPFPLSTAFATAMADAGSELAAFLGSRTDPYVASAQYSDLRDEKHTHIERHRSWVITATDGADAVAVRVTSSTYERTDLPVPVEVPVSGPTVESADAGEGPWAAPASVPGSLPTVQSVIARWNAASDPENAANTWGFNIRCAADCSGSSATVWAGWSDRYYPNEPQVGLATYQSVEEHSDMLAVDGGGNTVWAETVVTGREDRLVVGPIRTGDDPPAVKTIPGASPETAGLHVPWTGVAIVGGAVGLAVLVAVLAKLGLFGGLFSRHIEDVSAHPVRRVLLDAIQAQPGIHYSELLRRSGKGNSVASHHLRRLVASGLVLEKQGPRFLCYFPAGTSRAALAAGPLLKSPVAQGILDAAARGPIAGQALAARLGVAPGAISFHVQRLTQAGLLVSRRDGRYVLFEATAAGRQSVAGVEPEAAAAS